MSQWPILSGLIIFIDSMHRSLELTMTNTTTTNTIESQGPFVIHLQTSYLCMCLLTFGLLTTQLFKLNFSYYKDLKKFIKDVEFAWISQNFETSVKMDQKYVLRRPRKMHAKICTSFLFKKWVVIFVELICLHWICQVSNFLQFSLKLTKIA